MGKEEFDRLEYRYVLVPISYEKPWVTTVYMGSIKDFLHGVALKLRFFSKHSNTKPFIVSNNESTILELKIGDGEGGPLRRRKYRIDIPFGEAVDILGDINGFKKIASYPCKGSEKPFPVKLLRDVCLKEGIMGFAPRGATSYYREHFDLKEGRLTIDWDLTYWGLTNYFKDWYLYPVSRLGKCWRGSASWIFREMFGI